MQERRFSISESTLNELLNYLAGRPYVDVFGLVKKLQEQSFIVPPAADKDTSGPKATGPTLVNESAPAAEATASTADGATNGAANGNGATKAKRGRKATAGDSTPAAANN